MRKTAKILIFLLVFLVLILPALSLAANTPPSVLVSCDNSVNQPCNFAAFLKLVNNFINFILYAMAVPIAAIMFCYAGIKMVTSGGGEGKTKAKEIFANAVYGLLFIAAAWLIVKTILSILGFNGAWIGFTP